MAPALGVLARKATGPVRRLAAVYLPLSANMTAWTPATVGAFDLTPSLQPLASYKNQLTVITGLAHDPAVPRGQDAGQHSRVMASWLTGVRVAKTEGPGIRNGTSMDQL